MSIKAKCSICGRDFEMDDKWKGFVEKYPDRVKCSSCMKASTSKTSTNSKTTSSSSYSKPSSVKTTKQEVNAEMFRKAYDELIAEFSDVKDDVSPYLGGWVSTIVINRSK